MMSTENHAVSVFSACETDKNVLQFNLKKLFLKFHFLLLGALQKAHELVYTVSEKKRGQ